MADLKNIRQIGSPTETDKIFIENNAYQRIHREEFPERRVFVLMGHTECAATGYSSYVEAVIPVWDIAFSQGIPVWNNHVWNDVFGEVKRSFENSVIIGWALDSKGIPPRLTAELEAVHREHFGGAHQLLLLLDSIEQEEYFYQARAGHLRQREGFYIYFDSDCIYNNIIPEEVWMAKAKEHEVLQPDPEEKVQGDVVPMPRARYRDIINAQQAQTQQESGSWISSVAIIAAIVLLVAIAGTAVRQGRFSIGEIQQAVESLSERVHLQGKSENEADTQQGAAAETSADVQNAAEASVDGQNTAETSADAQNAAEDSAGAQKDAGTQEESQSVETMLRNMEDAQQSQDITVEEVQGGEIGSN